MRNVLERASARETAARVAVGALARQLLEYFGVGFASHVVRIGPVALPRGYDTSSLARIRELTEASEVRLPRPGNRGSDDRRHQSGEKGRATHSAVSPKLSWAACPSAWEDSSQWYHRLDGRLAGALMAIHLDQRSRNRAWVRDRREARLRGPRPDSFRSRRRSAPQGLLPARRTMPAVLRRG